MASEGGNSNNAPSSTDEAGGGVGVGLSKIRTKRIIVEPSSSSATTNSSVLPRFVDHDEYGFYEGDLITPSPASASDEGGEVRSSIRHGHGTMYYDNGDTYTGEFVNNKFQGASGVYRWHDGDIHSGEWHNGERNGVGVYHNNAATTDNDEKKRGSVEYSKYENGKAVGEGLFWNASRTVAHKLQDGELMHEVTLALAKKIAWDAFGLDVPEPSSIITTTTTTTPVATLPSTASSISPQSMPTDSSASSKPAASTKRTGLLGRLFSSRKEDSDGTLHFKDMGVWGTYDGAVDENGNRMGQGRMTYIDGTSYEGDFEDDKYHGNKGTYRWSDGDVHEGSWKEGKRHGKGVFHSADGSVEISMYDMDNPKGEGLTFTADRKTAHMLVDGKKSMELLIEEAEALVREKFGMPVPEAVVSTTKVKNGGVLKTMFSKGKKDANGKPMFKDHGEWGSYEGVVDENGKRQGKGKMTYTSGNFYDGEFVDDKFHCDKGIHHWVDGDEYEGQWKNGERQGIGMFRSADGSVNYSTYEGGMTVGEGVAWSADRKTAHKMIDGVIKTGISLALAEKLAKEKFNLPVPPVSVPSTTSPSAVVPSTTTGVGIFRRLFSNRKMDANGKPMFKDYGDWGSYDGDLDGSGNRQGKGKMTYESGAYYEGGFVNDKFHCESGIYHWSDGEEYVGEWKEGERNGIGIFRFADGTEVYSKYDNGLAKGNGIWWSADRKTAFTLLDGEKKVELLIEEAKDLAKDKFHLPFPEIRVIASENVASRQKTNLPNAADGTGNVTKPSEIERHYFVDNGDKGAYEGKLIDGLRSGKGSMSYDSGSSYEGDFLNGKFHGSNGVFRWPDGAEYEGSWKEGLFHGVGIFRTPNVGVDYSYYVDGYATGVGVSWNADFTQAYLTLDSVRMMETPLANARTLAATKFDLPDPSPKHGILSSIGRIFQRKKIGPDGKPMYKDHGDWGSYEGDVDENGKRQGMGKMTYESGTYYEGGFVDDKFDCDKGIYRWSDGAEYEGAWKNGERQGVGIFRSSDGSVDYSMYKGGSYEGPGVAWTADRKSAYKIIDGVRKDPISLAMAEKLAQEFHLPVPEPSPVVPSQSAAAPAPSNGFGILGKIFSKRKIDANGKPMFKDHGEWGTYDGSVDENGKRQGKGKMTYESGNYYDGEFVDDKFHGDNGIYHWFDGEEYQGSWNAGERHGVGIFRAADGCVDYSMYEYGNHKGEGVKFSSGRDTATILVDGEETNEITIEEAEHLVKERFGL